MLARAIISIAGVACALVPAWAAAQDAGPAAGVVAPYEIGGRTFAGLRFPLEAVAGTISLSGRQAWAWDETEVAGGVTHIARRVCLSGDVRMTLGPYSFSARRASVWLMQLPEEGGAWQVFAVLDQPGAAEQAAPISVTGGRLPVRGLIRAEDGIAMRADRLVQSRPPGPPGAEGQFVAESERLLSRRLRGMVEPELPASPPPGVREEDVLRRGQPAMAGTEEADERRAVREAARRLPPAGEREAPIFAKDGIISFSAGEITVVKEAETGERSVLLSGGVAIQYRDDRQNLQISAERGVVFLDAGAPEGAGAGQNLGVGDVRGFYLEGDVVASGDEHTIRSPRVYYSVRDERGVLLDAVFWTYDQRRQMPLYVRAKSIEQLSRNQFRATQAKLSNTPFFEPDLSIGVSTVTVTKREAAGGAGEPEEPGLHLEARDLTLRAGGVPFFYWPVLRGDVASIPLRDVRVENSTGSGVALKTRWNFYSLVGVDASPGNDAELIVDGYFSRGLALGSELRWRNSFGRGNLFGYGLPDDRGTDILPTGQRSSQDGDTRGIILAEHRAEIGEHWSIFAEASYISDPTFVWGFFPEMARDRREFTNSLYARRVEGDSYLFGEVRARATDFIPNEYLLQTPGYSVAKYPDVGYVRLADDLLKAHPGLLTYSSSYRFTQMRMEFSDPEVSELGYRAPSRSQALFGIQPDQSTADALRAMGLSEEPVARFDARHELSMQLGAGPLMITPFVTGRITAYDDTFESFSPEEDEHYRLWGSAGVTFATELSRVDNGVESRLLDLHRIRHIVQPSITLWHASTTVDRVDLPVFDDEVESLTEGSAARFAIDQTWQTQRGGPGRWRSVDVFKLLASIVTSPDDMDRKSPINRYFDYQPELSNLGGTFGTLSGAWQVTEVFALAGETVFDFEINQQARTAVGYTAQHAEFGTYGELRYINSQDQTYAILGARYDLTPKYRVSTSAAYDTDEGVFQTVSFDVRRRFPNLILGTGISYNNITGVTSFGFMLQPVGLGQGAQFRGIGDGFGS